MFIHVGLNEIGGFEAMRNLFIPSATDYSYKNEALFGNHTCGFPPEDSFHIFRAADAGSYPWPGMVFGLTILAINAWCTDQVINWNQLVLHIPNIYIINIIVINIS